MCVCVCDMTIVVELGRIFCMPCLLGREVQHLPWFWEQLSTDVFVVGSLVCPAARRREGSISPRAIAWSVGAKIAVL